MKLLNAPPFVGLLESAYYHSTRSTKNGHAVLRSGLVQPPKSVGKHLTSPRRGYVYVSSSLENAAIYALGGVMMEGDDHGKGKKAPEDR